MKTKIINNATDKMYNEMLKDKSIEVINYNSKTTKLVFRQRIIKFTMKVAYFDIVPKCKIVRFSDNNGDYLEFTGRNYIKDFVMEIFRKKYRGFKVFPLEQNSECVHVLSKYLSRHKFDVDLGFIGVKCIYIKLYLQKYFNKKGSISHSNIITFIGSAV